MRKRPDFVAATPRRQPDYGRAKLTFAAVSRTLRRVGLQSSRASLCVKTVPDACRDFGMVRFWNGTLLDLLILLIKLAFKSKSGPFRDFYSPF